MTTPFNGNTINERPLGGSESALFYLSRELAALGHKVVVFNNCFEGAGLYEGVEYRHFTTLLDLVNYSKKENFDIFISFRDLPAFLFPVNAKKRIWWGHDDFSNVWTKGILGIGFLRFAGGLSRLLVDKFFVVSEWLKQICMDYLKIPEDKIFVVRNGVHLPYFEENYQRHKYRLVYTSVPARGLDILLEIFPRIRAQAPDAKLHIFCGFDLGMLKEADRKQAQKIYDRTNQPGVILRGTLKHNDLAKELLKSYLWVYPSHAVLKAGFYAETSCIAALEAQAAGLPVIASHRGALLESVLNQQTGILIEGDPYSKEYQERFVQETVELLKNEGRWQTYSQNAPRWIKENFSWKKIASEWDKELKCLISQS